MQGWIALHRCLIKKAIWQKSTPEQKTILITLLMLANHKDQEWEWKGMPFKAKPGQFVTSIDSIKKAAGKGITTQNVRTALARFEKYEFLTNESTKTGRLISITNWEHYQSRNDEGNKEDDKDITKHQQSGNKGLTPNNNDNKGNNEKQVLILSADEQAFIEILETVKNYPLDREKDREMFNTLKGRYPNLDLVESIRDWAAYKLDKPLGKTANPRSQINTSFKKYSEWGKNLKGGSQDGRSVGENKATGSTIQGTARSANEKDYRRGHEDFFE